MGVVIRQGIKYVAVSYAFMLISILASLFLFPLNTDLYGIFTFFVDTAMLLLPLALLGIGMVSLKYFPEYYKKSGSGNDLVTAGILVIVVGVSLISIVGFLFHDALVELYRDKSGILDISAYLWMIIPMLIVIGLQNFLAAHSTNYRRTAYPKFIQSLWRFSFPLIFIGVHFNFISAELGLMLALVHFLLATMLLFGFLHRLDPLRIRFSDQVFSFIRRKDVLIYGLFAMLTSLGSSLAFKLDTFMVTTLLDTANTGVYAIGNRIGSVIAVPTMAILGIVTPIISSAMRDKRFDEIQSVYRRSSEVLTIAGVIMLAGLAVIAHDLFSLMYKGEEMIRNGALQVVALIALARLIDMMTSVNGQIISLSAFFKFNLYFLIFLGVANMVLNLVLIPRMGISGAALATFISLASFNVIKVLFIKRTLDMWPFTRTTFVILLTGVCATGCILFFGRFLPFPSYINIVCKGALVVLMITLILYFFDVSSDFNHAIGAAIKRIRAVF